MIQNLVSEIQTRSLRFKFVRYVHKTTISRFKGIDYPKMKFKFIAGQSKCIEKQKKHHVLIFRSLETRLVWISIIATISISANSHRCGNQFGMVLAAQFRQCWFFVAKIQGLLQTQDVQHRPTKSYVGLRIFLFKNVHHNISSLNQSIFHKITIFLKNPTFFGWSRSKTTTQTHRMTEHWTSCVWSSPWIFATKKSTLSKLRSKTIPNWFPQRCELALIETVAIIEIQASLVSHERKIKTWCFFCFSMHFNCPAINLNFIFG